MSLDRRRFLLLLGTGVTGAYLGLESGGLSAWAADAPAGPFTLPPLPYAYNALAPHIDERTMQIHHDKHHAAYVSNLNAAIARYPDLKNKTAEALLKTLDTLPADIRTTVRNNGGGHVNHSLFWEIMSPEGGGEPKGAIGAAIQKQFGSFAAFQKEFTDAGMKRFGSGWAWLVKDQSGKLQVISTANQDSPLMEGLIPVLGNDLWEHAYYLTYQNRRADYLKAWWNVVNWAEVDRRYTT